MLERFKRVAREARVALGRAANRAGDLNGDGKVDEKDTVVATEWAKGAVGSVASESGRLARAAVRSDLTKDAAAGAAVGAALTIPIPIIGPVAGAVIGAGLGVYKNLTQRGRAVNQLQDHSRTSVDIHAELIKLDDLRQKKLITDAEFETLKKKLLD